MPVSSFDRVETDAQQPPSMPAVSAPMPHLPLVPTVLRHGYSTVLPACTETFVVRDGMNFKEAVLLTSDWAVQPIKVLKAHIAPRWRTKQERLATGTGGGRFADQPHDDELCNSIATPVAGLSAEVWLWPAEIPALPMQRGPPQPQQLPLPPLRHTTYNQPEPLAHLPSLPSLTSLPGSDCQEEEEESIPTVPDTAPSTPQTAPQDGLDESEASPIAVKEMLLRVADAGIMEVYREEGDALTLAITNAEVAELIPLAAAIPAAIDRVLQPHHPQLHAAVAELLNRVPSGPALQEVLAAMEECTGQLLEVPALFSATFSRMEETQRGQLLQRAVAYVLPFADRPRAGLALEACIRMQCTEGAEGGVAVVKPLLDEILTHCATLMRSGSGNFLVQQCIQLAPSEFADSIAARIKGTVESMSLHRHASHAVEQVLKHVSEPYLHDLLSELVRSSLSARRLACSQSGNYVLQAAIKMCPPSLWEPVSLRIKACLPELTPVSAERIWVKLCETAASTGLYLDLTQNFVSAPKKGKRPAGPNGKTDPQRLPQSVMMPMYNVQVGVQPVAGFPQQPQFQHWHAGMRRNNENCF